MTKIAALQSPTLALSEARLDHYLRLAKEGGAGLFVLGEYVLNSFFTELLRMSPAMISEQSAAKKASLIRLSQKHKIHIIAPIIWPASVPVGEFEENGGKVEGRAAEAGQGGEGGGGEGLAEFKIAGSAPTGKGGKKANPEKSSKASKKASPKANTTPANAASPARGLFKKLCLSISPSGVESYEQQLLMPYTHWDEAGFFANEITSPRLFTLDYAGLNCALIFGFEAHFDFFWQEARAQKIDLIIIPTASTFSSKDRWERLLSMRAFLNSLSILRVNRLGSFAPRAGVGEDFYGHSFYVDAFGEIQDELGSQEELLIISPASAAEARRLWGFEQISARLKKP